MLREISCKSAVNKVGGMPYSMDLNIYRGCGHGCRYCFALYSHDYLEAGDFYRDIFVKKNVVEVLERELRNPKVNCGVINIGGVTDSYQPAEAEKRLMPEIWRLMIRHKTPVCISTKSDLILRDIDLIAELASVAQVNVAATVTAMDETVRKMLEPGAVSSKRRLEMLRQMKAAGAIVGVHMMPLVPLLTDDQNNIDRLFAAAQEYGDYAIVCAMNLRGRTRRSFLEFIRRSYPELLREMQALYRDGHLDKAYKKAMYARVQRALEKYPVSLDYNVIHPRQEYRQLTLFE